MVAAGEKRSSLARRCGNPGLSGSLDKASCYDSLQADQLTSGQAHRIMQKNRYYRVEEQGDTIIAQIVDPNLQGDALAECLRLELLQIVAERSPKLVVIDFQNVKLVSSLAIASLLTVNQRLASMGVYLKMCSMNESLRHLFRTLRLDGSLFKIYATMSDALSAPMGSPTYEDVVGRPTPFDPTESGG